MGNWKIYNQDVMEWSESYDGEPFHAMLCDPPYHLYSPVSKSGSRPTDPLSESKYNAYKGDYGQEVGRWSNRISTRNGPIQHL
jgi:tRNA1(Val) A37 N6-methylase TrmN6